MTTKTTENPERLTEAEVLEHITKAREFASKGRATELPPTYCDMAFEELTKAVQGWVCGVKNE